MSQTNRIRVYYMYDDKIIKKLVKKVCAEANVTTHIYPNGERAEGYSFIVTGMLYSWVIEALIKAINEAFPDADPLGTWRLQNGKLQVPCPGVKKEQYDECMEIRLMWAKYNKN